MTQSPSVAAVFTACIDCFGYVQLGRYLGRDFQADQQAFNQAKLRLTQWGQAVNIYADPKLGRSDANPAEIQTAKDNLLQILLLFADTDQISKKHKLSVKAGDSVSILGTDAMDPAVMAKIKELAVRRQKDHSVLKTASRVLSYKSELKELISGITSLIDQVETLFPGRQSQVALVTPETPRVHYGELIKPVEGAGQDIHSLPENTAPEALPGHQYSKIVIKGKAHVGDAISSEWKGKMIGAAHTYADIEVDKDGKALIGNQYGGNDFWND